MKKLRCASFFAGVGGIDLGFEQTGAFKTVYANEFIIPAYEIEGVENLTNLQVGIYGSGSMSDSQTVIDTSLAMFNIDWITLNEI